MLVFWFVAQTRAAIISFRRESPVNKTPIHERAHLVSSYAIPRAFCAPLKKPKLRKEFSFPAVRLESFGASSPDMWCVCVCLCVARWLCKPRSVAGTFPTSRTFRGSSTIAVAALSQAVNWHGEVGEQFQSTNAQPRAQTCSSGHRKRQPKPSLAA